MKTTELLMGEHRVIEQVLGCLEAMIDEAGRNGRLDAGPASDALMFFRAFADRCHHAKEEGPLFDLLEERGYPRTEGPVAVMLAEHEQGRACVRAMTATVEGAARGERLPLDEFSRNGREFIDLLRSHILKEDRILYPLADQIFDGPDQRDLAAAVEHVDQHHVEPGTHDRYLGIAEQLGSRYGVERPGGQNDVFCWSCGGHACG